MAHSSLIAHAFDFDAPGTLPGTRECVGHLLLISGSEISRHERQHCAAIDAAKSAGLAKRIAVMLVEASAI